MPFAKIIQTIILIGVGILTASAQAITLSSDSQQFIKDFEDVFKKSKNEVAVSEFNTFRTIYENSLPAESKANFIVLCQNMARRNHKMPEYYQLLVLMNQGALHQTQRNKLISYLKIIAGNKSLKETAGLFISLQRFLSSGLLYTSQFNKLYALNGSFDFNFYEKETSFFAEEKDVVKTATPGLFDNWDKEEYDPWNDPELDMKPGSTSRLIPLPKINNLVIVLEGSDLAFVTKSDSLLIRNTSGAADLLAENFVGKGGSVSWENVFLPQVKATLTEYTFRIHNPYVKAEGVTLTYDDYLEAPIEGVFELKAVSRNARDQIEYPRFKSYENNARFRKLDAGFTYTGGFSLIGKRIFSTSLYNNISTLWVNKGQTNSFKIDSKQIEFSDSLITSPQVIFMTPIGEDSIFHQAVQLRYELPEKLLTLTKVPRGGFRSSMYSDTFHKMDIKCDAMKWDLNTGKMDFVIVAGRFEVPAVFESFNYYNQSYIRELSNVVGFNPLIFLGNYLAKKGTNRFTIFEVQDKVPSKTPLQVKNGILVTLQMGFLNYNPHSDTYSLSRKGLHYFKAATGTGDYDDLVFASISKEGAGNASINRESMALDISGTKEFKLSDSLGIRFLPKDEMIKMKGGKSFEFNGEIEVKNYRIYGNFDVDYGQFVVDLKRIDSILFTPAEIYRKGGKYILGRNITYGKTGTLYLNAPDNKSGRKSLPQYPRLIVPDGAIAYFNETYRKEAYGSDMFFKVDKIDHDSLNIMNLVYQGTFHSGGIFEPFRESLVVMPDTSIGFVHRAKTSYKLYETPSEFRFDEPLVMTRQGLISKGRLTHLAAQFSFGDTRFSQNEMTMKGNSGVIKESNLTKDNYFPDVKIADYSLRWKPSEDSLILSSKETFSFYNATTKLAGSLVLRNSGLYGQGRLDRKDSETRSNSIKFNKFGFYATESGFLVRSDGDNEKPVLDGQRVDVNFDFQNQMVSISPVSGTLANTETASITFPYAAYKTSIDNAVLDIRKKTISMKGDLESSRFTATASNQYGLHFNGTEALYDIAQNTLNVSGVPGINSVDAIIVPANGQVAVLREGKLEPFVNATIVVDTVNKYHTLTNANITVNSRVNYSGNASYRFVNASGEVFNIKMEGFQFVEVTPDGRQITDSKKSGRLSTIAKARLTEKDSVFLSPKILYIGDITMVAPLKNLNLKGQVTPVLPAYPVLSNNWINYSGNKSEEVVINVDETLKDGGKPLYAGLHINPASTSEVLYPTFLSAKREASDHNVFLAKGVFRRDEKNKRFVIESSSKNDRSASANTYELYDEKGLILLNGHYNLLSPDIAQFAETIGLSTIRLDSVTYDFNTLMKFSFPIPIPVVNKMGGNVVKANLDAGNSDPGFVFDSPEFISKMSAFLSPREAQEYVTQYPKGHIPLPKFSPKFLSAIVFSDLKLRWNPAFNAYRSIGKIGISNIGETDINASVPGYFELIKNPRLGDELYIFLELSPDSWYYIGYKGGQLGMISSDFEFNKMLGTDEKTKSSKGIEIMGADMAEAMAFRKRFLMSYLGVSEEAFKQPARTPVATPGQVAPVQIPPAASQEGSPAPAQPARKPPVEQQDGF